MGMTLGVMKACLEKIDNPLVMSRDAIKVSESISLAPVGGKKKLMSLIARLVSSMTLIVST